MPECYINPEMIYMIHTFSFTIYLFTISGMIKKNDKQRILFFRLADISLVLYYRVQLKLVNYSIVNIKV